MSKQTYIFTTKVDFTLKKLMEMEGQYVSVMIHPNSNGSSGKLLKTVTDTLKMMGIKYQHKKDTRMIRILNADQLKAYENLKTGTFSQRYGYVNDKYLKYTDIIQIDEVF